MATHKIAKISVSVVDGISVWRRNDSTIVYCCGVSGLVCEKSSCQKLFQNASGLATSQMLAFRMKPHNTPFDTLHE